MQMLGQLGRRAAHKAVPAILIVTLALTAVGMWLFLRDEPAMETERSLLSQTEKVAAGLAVAQQRMDQIVIQLSPELVRAAQLKKVIGDLKHLTNWWAWLAGNREQYEANLKHLQRMEVLRDVTAARLTTLQRELNRAKAERDRKQSELRRLNSRFHAEQSKESSVPYYLRQAWLRARVWVFVALAIYLLGPVIVPIVAGRWREREEA